MFNLHDLYATDVVPIRCNSKHRTLIRNTICSTSGDGDLLYCTCIVLNILL